MRTCLLIFALGGAASWAGGPKADDPVQAELKRLQGSWVVEGAFLGGAEREELKDGRLVFEGTTCTSRLAGKEARGEFKLDPSKKVREIDWTERRRTVLGVYELDGDTLKLCLGTEERRPGKVNKDDLLYVLRRAKE